MPVSGDLFVSRAALSIPAKSPFSVIFSWSPSGSSRIAWISARMRDVTLGERDDVQPANETRGLEDCEEVTVGDRLRR